MDQSVWVSVIVPIYNVERDLPRSIKSFAGQTLKDIEILLVDDGSLDGSGAMADAFARNDSRITVIHKENGGAASARNAAIKIARGKYLYFADPDDWVELDALQKMARFAEENALEAVISGFFIHTYYDLDRCHTSVHTAKTQVFPTRSAFREDAYRLFDTNLLYPPWNKLFLAAYIRDNQIEFPDTFWDDFPFNLAVFRDISAVGVLETPFYHFTRARSEAETQKYRPGMYEKREEEHQWMLELYRHWGISDANSREMIARRYVERIAGCLENLANPQCELTLYARIAKIREIIKSPSVRDALRIARPRSFYMKLMLLPIRMKCACLCYLEGRVISRVKSGNTRIFAALKAGR